MGIKRISVNFGGQEARFLPFLTPQAKIFENFEGELDFFIFLTINYRFFVRQPAFFVCFVNFLALIQTYYYKLKIFRRHFYRPPYISMHLNNGLLDK
uniref:Uncharacterized protein n=1 Tax=Meloidogyne enterolobii TaxID=390850 RepID=A0A6V7XC34_MELEN|nr:unnamed protein product [Meloidogyne enterolobii]